jgi:hypothetical protein
VRSDIAEDLGESIGVDGDSSRTCVRLPSHDRWVDFRFGTRRSQKDRERICALARVWR